MGDDNCGEKMGQLLITLRLASLGGRKAQAFTPDCYFKRCRRAISACHFPKYMNIMFL